MKIEKIREQIKLIMIEYIKEWLENNPNSSIIDLINENEKIKNEIYKELNIYDEKLILKEINKKLLKKLDENRKN